MIRTVKIGRYTLHGDDASTTQRSMLENGMNYELHVRKELERLVPKSKGFIDAGANIGIHTLNVKDINPDIFCIAFEPSQFNFRTLTKNIEENGLTHIRSHRIALANHSGFVYGNLDPDNMQCTPDGKSDDYPRIIPCDPLDMFDTVGFDLMKIDVEGFEYAVWQGASEFFKRRPTVIFEFCPRFVHRSKVTPVAQLEWIIAQGYRLTVLDHMNNGSRKVCSGWQDVMEHPGIKHNGITDILAEPIN